jgi:hypothetical protein
MNRTPPNPDDLKPRLARAADEYGLLKRNAEASVVRWIWATDAVRSLNPGFDAKIKGWPEGKELASPPTRRAGNFEYGVDADGRTVVCRFYSELEGHFAEEFYVPRGDCVEVWSYGPDPQYKAPRGVSLYHYASGRVVDYVELNRDGRTQAEVYDYIGDRLDTLHRVRRNPNVESTYHHEYDPDGTLARVTVETGTGKRGVVYKRPTRTVAALTRVVAARLTELIPKRVAGLSVPGPAFCLALAYDPGSYLSMLPPKLAVGLEAERVRWRAGGGEKESLWDAQGFGTFDDDRLEFDDAVLLAATGELSEQLRSRDDLDKAHRLLVNVARDLNKVDFGKLIMVMPDFVVYPVDLHLEHLKEDLKAALPSAKLKALRARGEAP